MFKQLSIILLALIMSVGADAQSRRYEKAMSSFGASHRTTAISLSSEAVQLANNFDLGLTKEARKLIEDVDNVRFVFCNKGDARSYSDALAAFAQSGFEQLDVSSYAAPGKVSVFIDNRLTTITEFHLVLNKDVCTIISINGKFGLRDIKRFVRAMEEQRGGQ